MSKRFILEKDRPKYPVDLTQYNAEPDYLCEDCGCVLALYPSHLAAEYWPTERGPHYICPECHIVIDSSLEKPAILEDIKPLDLSAPAFIMVPEDKGTTLVQPKPYDPEPDEEQWLKNIGATLISKKVEVNTL